MRFGSTAQVLLKCKLKYYRISEWDREQGGKGRKAYESYAEAIQLWSKGDQELTVQIRGGGASRSWPPDIPSQHGDSFLHPSRPVASHDTCFCLPVC